MDTYIRQAWPIKLLSMVALHAFCLLKLAIEQTRTMASPFLLHLQGESERWRLYEKTSLGVQQPLYLAWDAFHSANIFFLIEYKSLLPCVCWISKAALLSLVKTISSMRFSCFSSLSVCSDVAKTEMMTIMGE